MTRREIIFLVLFAYFFFSPDPFLGEKKKCEYRHEKKFQKVKFKGTSYNVLSLPRCEHVQVILAYNSQPETRRRVRERLKKDHDIAFVATGPFYKPKTIKLVDYVQKPGHVIEDFWCGRHVLVSAPGRRLEILPPKSKIPEGATVIALGQRFIPLEKDGFDESFMRQVTPRMAIGLADDKVYVVWGTSNIRKLAQFMGKLGCKQANNLDGGHTVSGSSPVHTVLIWKGANQPVYPRNTPLGKRASSERGPE